MIGIVAGSLVAVAAIGLGAFELIEQGTDAAFPEATHRLVVQKAVLDDEFSLSQDMSETEGAAIEDTFGPGIRNGKAAVAQYAPDEGGVLVLSGMYGRLATPAFMRDRIMKGAAESEGAKVVIPARTFEPDGYDVTVECQVVRSTDLG